MLKLIRPSKAFSFINKFSFSTSSRDKDKILSDLFKLPKHDLHHEAIFENDIKNDDFNQSVLQKYKSAENIEEVELTSAAFKKRRLEANNDTEKFFKNLTEQETIKLSENLIEKLRLKKEVSFDEEYKKKSIQNEYGNYDKYFKNYTKLVDSKYESDDDGNPKWFIKHQELEEKYNNPHKKSMNAKANQMREESLRLDLEKVDSKHYNFVHHLASKREDSPVATGFNWYNTYPDAKIPDDVNPGVVDKSLERRKPKEEEEIIGEGHPHFHHKLDKELMFIPYEGLEEKSIFHRNTTNTENSFSEKDTLQTLEVTNLYKFNNITWGRLSPWAREDIYRLYLEGWSIKDLSYKYGILPQRVKVIVWCRDLFWREVYPKIGETGMKMMLEREIQYAHEFKFVDYGKDLYVMAQIEQGVELRQLNGRYPDTDPTEFSHKKYDTVLERLGQKKPKQMNFIPIKFVGKGTKGYLVKEMSINRGRGSKRVTRMYRKFLNYCERDSYLLPMKIRRRTELPPRCGSFGYRDNR